MKFIWLRRIWKAISRGHGPHPNWNPEILIRASDPDQVREAALVFETGQNLSLYVFGHGANIRPRDRVGVLIHVKTALESISLKWVSERNFQIDLICEDASEFAAPWKAAIGQTKVEVCDLSEHD